MQLLTGCKITLQGLLVSLSEQNRIINHEGIIICLQIVEDRIVALLLLSGHYWNTPVSDNLKGEQEGGWAKHEISCYSKHVTRLIDAISLCHYREGEVNIPTLSLIIIALLLVFSEIKIYVQTRKPPNSPLLHQLENIFTSVVSEI